MDKVGAKMRRDGPPVSRSEICPGGRHFHCINFEAPSILAGVPSPGCHPPKGGTFLKVLSCLCSVRNSCGRQSQLNLRVIIGLLFRLPSFLFGFSITTTSLSSNSIALAQLCLQAGLLIYIYIRREELFIAISVGGVRATFVMGISSSMQL